MRGAAFLDRPFTSVTRGVVPLRNRACPRSVCDSRTAKCCSRRTLSRHAAAAMASRPKSSGGYKRSVASERAVYMCAPPAPFITNPQRGAWLWRAPCEAGEAIANNDILLPVLRLRAQSRTEDFYRSPGRCEHALKKSWPEPRSFQHAYARQKRRTFKIVSWCSLVASTTQRSGGVARNDSANLSSSWAEASETAQYVTSPSVQRTMLYPASSLSAGAEFACPAAGMAVRLMRSFPSR